MAAPSDKHLEEALRVLMGNQAGRTTWAIALQRYTEGRGADLMLLAKAMVARAETYADRDQLVEVLDPIAQMLFDSARSGVTAKHEPARGKGRRQCAFGWCGRSASWRVGTDLFCRAHVNAKIANVGVEAITITALETLVPGVGVRLTDSILNTLRQRASVRSTF